MNCNPQGDIPVIGNESYVHPGAVIVGNVKIGNKVFIAPGAIIRADEPGSSVVIEDSCNIQDRVVIHGLEGSKVIIRERTSIAHGAIIHGPCVINKNSFVGFGAVVFNAQLGAGAIIGHSAVVEKVNIPAGRIVESGQVVNNDQVVDCLGEADGEMNDFACNVVNVNLDLVKGYLGK